MFSSSSRCAVLLAGFAIPALALAEVPADKGVPGLQVIAGKPRERGRQYGSLYKEEIRAFLDREIYKAFVKQPNPREDMLRYAAGCAKAIQQFSPVLHEEL